MSILVETRHVSMAPWRYLVSTTEEQRRYGQKDQDLVCTEFSGHDTCMVILFSEFFKARKVSFGLFFMKY